MKIIFLAVLAAVVPAATQAQSPSVKTVERAGYTYQVIQLSPQTYQLRGRLSDGRRFRLSVTGRRVIGRFDGDLVSFALKDRGLKTDAHYAAAN